MLTERSLSFSGFSSTGTCAGFLLSYPSSLLCLSFGMTLFFTGLVNVLRNSGAILQELIPAADPPEVTLHEYRNIFRPLLYPFLEIHVCLKRFPGVLSSSRFSPFVPRGEHQLEVLFVKFQNQLWGMHPPQDFLPLVSFGPHLLLFTSQHVHSSFWDLGPFRIPFPLLLPAGSRQNTCHLV